MNFEQSQGKVIVTSGKKYIDIDAYASCIVYANILKTIGVNAIAVTTAELNESVPKEIFGDKNQMLKEYNYAENDKFIILDVSNKEYFDTFVKEQKIIKIVDHHYGFEDYGRKKLGDNSIIESIGAVATIVVEIAEKNGYLNIISDKEVYLLMAAILDNTLNFNAKITTNRDKEAYKKLKRIVKENNFEKKYFEECQNTIKKDLKKYIRLATKCEKINNKLPPIFSQLVVWNKNFIISNMSKIVEELDSIGEEWILNLIVLQERKSYIISTNYESKKKIEKLFEKKFKENILDLQSIWLRKEIIKKSFE